MRHAMIPSAMVDAATTIAPSRSGGYAATASDAAKLPATATITAGGSAANGERRTSGATRRSAACRYCR